MDGNGSNTCKSIKKAVFPLVDEHCLCLDFHPTAEEVSFFTVMEKAC